MVEGYMKCKYVLLTKYLWEKDCMGKIRNIYEYAQKLKDFLDSTDKIAPEYQQAAWLECCAVMMEYYQKHNVF